MATVTCDLNTLITQAKCFACFSQKENQAAIVYLLEARRAALAGAAIRSASTLRSAAACMSCIPVDPIADANDAAIAQAGATAAGAATLSISALRAAINPFANMSLDDLRTLEIFLRCQLNAYP